MIAGVSVVLNRTVVVLISQHGKQSDAAEKECRQFGTDSRKSGKNIWSGKYRDRKINTFTWLLIRAYYSKLRSLQL